MKIEDTRTHLEQVIIGTCVLEGGYDRIAGVLTNRNFSQMEPYNHQVIFKGIEALYPNRPVDLITLTHEIKQPGYASYLAHCSSLVSRSCHLRYHAFLLLQMSMRDAMINLLSKAGGKHVNNTTQAALQEIIDECLDHSNDILGIYETAPAYLRKIGTDESIVLEIQELDNALREKVKAVKSQAHIDSLIQNLTSLNEIGTDIKSRLCLSHLTDAIKLIVIKGSVSDDALMAIQGIRGKLI